ncbi:4'-phosphopantetheinyl transferase [Filimonas lacunae]|uniref:4'-phosphopantetheinyl transferase n=2 Tax=Filimonas lacunae TaxID=477680 RepID=A0A173MCW6_9BACT|nr:4'-phosphopantetheinyl transferase [Filimonas lacunae]SIT22113.1 4'-phosphopantetheinyl transferase [Filimonas lacunae]
MGKSGADISILHWQGFRLHMPVRSLTGQAYVFRVNVSDSFVACDKFEYLLTDKEQARAARYRKLDDYQRFTVGRVALKLLLAKFANVPANKVVVQQQGAEKPFTELPVSFNVSHSGNWVVLAFSALPVGVDVEFINNHFSYRNMLPATFHPQEIAYIEQSSNSLEQFYRLWTAKEAWFKKEGAGVAGELWRENMLQNDSVTCFAVDGRHTAAIACTGKAGVAAALDFTIS